MTALSADRYVWTATLSWKFWRAIVSGLKIHSTRAGSKKIVNSVENAMAKVLLYASGSKSRASRCSKKKTGKNEARMIKSENRRGLVTDAIDRTSISCR